MASREELQALRDEAYRRHRAATRKVSRLKQDRGVSVSGTRADPRRQRSRIRSYTASQLKSYINQLNSFTSRRTQFVPDASGKPMAGQTWKQYKNLESKYNARVEKEFSKVADIHVPAFGMTVEQRMEMMRPPIPQALSPAVNSPYRPPSRKPTNMASERALKRLIGDMKTRLKPNYFNRLLNNARDEYGKMSQLINHPELDRKVAALTDEQFSLLWNYTGFATNESLVYEHTRSLLSDKEKPHHAEQINTAMGNMHELVDWASGLDLGS